MTKRSKPLSLTDCLSVGETNAVTAKDLARLLNWRERDVTLTVNALRKQGELICSGSSGFWLPGDDNDIVMFVHQMQGRIRDMKKATQPAIDYLNARNSGVKND